MSDAEAYASYQAWLHTECGLDKHDQACYTPQELNALQLGWLIRERGGSDRLSPHERGRREKRTEMLDDIGFE